MCEVEITPRSVCVRTAPGNVNMVAYGKINTRLSPAGVSATQYFLRIVLRELQLVKGPDTETIFSVV